MLRFLQEYLAKCLPSNWHCLINTPCDPFFNWKRQIQTEKKTGIKNSVCYIDLQVLIFFWKYLCPIVTNPCKFYEEVIHEGMGRGGEEGFVPLPTHLTYLSRVFPSMKCISWLVTIYYWIQDDREEKTVTADKTARAAT